MAATVDTAVGAVETAMLSLAPAPMLGYSQGGRVALLTASRHPDLASCLITISAGAGIDDPDLRLARAEADRALAARMRGMTLDEFLTEWTSRGPTATDHLEVATREADLAIRRQNSVEGLAAALEGYGQGAQPSIWDSLDRITCPVMVMSGSGDARYTEVGDRLTDLLPHAEHVIIEGAGHNPLADRPEPSAAAISDFLDRHS